MSQIKRGISKVKLLRYIVRILKINRVGVYIKNSDKRNFRIRIKDLIEKNKRRNSFKFV